jgi:pimeloyl-ACP methyl ester carboxylesterase
MVVILAACDGSSSASPSEGSVPSPSASASVADPEGYETVACPDAVTENAGDGNFSCGYLTVPENQATSDGPEIRLFVARSHPADVSGDDPMFVVGTNIPWQTNFDGVAVLAELTSREIVVIDQRGTGYSEPSLTCDEIWALPGTAGTGTPSVDGFPESEFLDAVQACHDRLAGAGIDLAAYDVAAAAEDLEDLRTTLGFDQVNLISYGTASRVALEVVRNHPETVRSIILDSPAVPQVDAFSQGIAGTRAALAHLYAECEADPACAAYGDIESLMNATLADLDANPVVTPADGREVVVDGALLLRSFRDGLGLPDWIPFLPSAIASFVEFGRSWPADSPTVDAVLYEPPLTTGYVPDYAPNEGDDETQPHQYSHGLQYTVTCRDELAFADPARLAELAAGESWYANSFVDSIWTDLCAIWDVGAADPATHELVTAEVPLLTLVGGYDPWASLDATTQLAEGFSTHWVYEVPTLTHFVFGGEIGNCPKEIRNAFVQDPTAEPDASCIADMEPLGFETE